MLLATLTPSLYKRFKSLEGRADTRYIIGKSRSINLCHPDVSPRMEQRDGEREREWKKDICVEVKIKKKAEKIGFDTA